MKFKVISKQSFNSWVDALIKNQKTIGVKEKEAGKFHFGKLAKATELTLDYDVTILPPKKYIQPVSETLFSYNISNYRFDAATNYEPLLIIGVHPYDMRAINQMDKVFTDENKDSNYIERRKNITIIAETAIPIINSDPVVDL